MFRHPSLLLTALLLTTPLMAAEPATSLKGCAAKHAAIESKINEARAHGNQEQVAGLEAALEQSKAHCTDAGLAQERKQRVLDAEKEVSQREKDLREAVNKGDAGKIEKRRTKLAEARAELDQARRELGQ
ncbi:hypothetical protein D3C78_1081120 [compost metagenome]